MKFAPGESKLPPEVLIENNLLGCGEANFHAVNYRYIAAPCFVVFVSTPNFLVSSLSM